MKDLLDKIKIALLNFDAAKYSSNNKIIIYHDGSGGISTYNNELVIKFQNQQEMLDKFVNVYYHEHEVEITIKILIPGCKNDYQASEKAIAMLPKDCQVLVSKTKEIGEEKPPF